MEGDRHNIGVVDRVARLGFGAALFVTALLSPALASLGPAAIIGALLLAAILLATGMFGVCPIYRLFGVCS